MTTQHIGDEDGIVTEQSAEEDSPHTAEPAENPETEETTENEQPEPTQTPQEMDRSLPAPTAFNINATDLYSEWKHWVSAFEIYSIASDLRKTRFREPLCCTALALQYNAFSVRSLVNTRP